MESVSKPSFPDEINALVLWYLVLFGYVCGLCRNIRWALLDPGPLDPPLGCLGALCVRLCL